MASSMPSGNPRRGFPAKSLPPEAFSTLLRLPKATKAVGRCPTPCQLSFEKAGQRTSSASAPAALRRRSQRNHRRARALTSRSSASVSSPLQGANCPGCNPRGRAFTSRSGAAFRRRPLARIAQSEHGPQLPEARTALTEPRCSSSYLFFLTNRYTMAITARMAITVPTPKPPPTNREPIWYTIKDTT